MRRALQLARTPIRTSPNPRVGAVVVSGGEVVGEGSHEGAGTAHAETRALEQAGPLADGATLYVTLEPCMHEGRTPPCAPAVADAGIARVFAAIEDPDPRVAGSGIGYLKERGIEVDVGLLSSEAAEVNRGFLHQRRTGRPLVTLKLALTLDGRLGAPDRSSRWITGEGARRMVHQRRAEVDAIVIGAGTALADDPELTARDVAVERQPVRVLVDAAGRVPPWARIFATDGVIVATTNSCPPEAEVAWKEAGAEIVQLPAAGRGVDLNALVANLAERDWIEVLCEGGAELASSLLRENLVDRLELHHGPLVVGRGGPDIGDLGIASMDGARAWDLVSVQAVGDDVISIYDRKA